MGFWLGEGGNGLGTLVTKWEQFWREDSILSLNCLWISVCVCVYACTLRRGATPLLWLLLCLQHLHLGLAQSHSPESVHHGAESQWRGPTEELAPGNGLRWVQASNGAGALGTHLCCLLTVPMYPP